MSVHQTFHYSHQTNFQFFIKFNFSQNSLQRQNLPGQIVAFITRFYCIMLYNCRKKKILTYLSETESLIRKWNLHKVDNKTMNQIKKSSSKKFKNHKTLKYRYHLQTFLCNTDRSTPHTNP